MNEKTKTNIILSVAHIVKGVIATEGEFASVAISKKVINFLESIDMLHDIKGLKDIIKETINEINMGPIEDPIRTVPAVSFVALLEANVDNKELEDKDFRDFVRNTLPIIIFPSKKKEENENNDK